MAGRSPADGRLLREQRAGRHHAAGEQLQPHPGRRRHRRRLHGAHKLRGLAERLAPALEPSESVRDGARHSHAGADTGAFRPQ